MNKRIKKKRAILLCIQGLITVNNKLVDKVEHQRFRAVLFRMVPKQN